VNVRQLSRIGGVALTAVAAVTMLAACGGGSSKAAAASTASPSASGANASIQAYISCLGKNGVTIALPSRSPGTGARPSGRPTGVRPSRSPGAGFGGGFTGGGGFGGGGSGFGGGGIFNDPSNPPTGVSATAWTSALAACKSLAPTFNRGAGGAAGGGAAYQAYLTCLKSHGVTASAAPGNKSTADPKVAAAMKTCAPLRPTGRPTNAPSPTN